MYSSVLDRLLAATVLRLPPRIDSKRSPPLLLEHPALHPVLFQ